MKMSQDAQATGEWAARCVSLTEHLLAMTRTAAGLAVGNAFLRAQASEHPNDLGEVGDAMYDLGIKDGRVQGGYDSESFGNVMDEVERNFEQQLQQLRAERDQLVTERDDWKTQFELADASCNNLTSWLKDREDRLAELSTDWEAQGSKIMDLERQLAARPDECPECFENLVPKPLAEPAAEATPPELLAFGTKKACKSCQAKFVAAPSNRKYCDACKAPKKGADQ